jgi:hypothetical protein
MMRTFLNGGNTVFYEKRNCILKMYRTTAKSRKTETFFPGAIHFSLRVMSFAAAKCPPPEFPKKSFRELGHHNTQKELFP